MRWSASHGVIIIIAIKLVGLIRIRNQFSKRNLYLKTLSSRSTFDC